MIEITLLRKKDVEGSRKLSILKKCGLKSIITDFALLLGGDTWCKVENYDRDKGSWILNSNSSYVSSSVSTVTKNGNIHWQSSNERSGGIRPSTKYSEIKNIVEKKKRNKQGILEIEYGEYPQTIVDDDISNLLEELYRKNELTKTGKIYTTDSISLDYKDREKQFTPREHIEYEYKGERYIRVKVTSDKICDKKLSNGKEIKKESEYWVKVEPIKWLVDEERDIALSKDILVSGIRVNEDRFIEYAKSEIKKFLDNWFSKEILSKRERELLKKTNNTIDNKEEQVKKKINLSLLEYDEAFYSSELDMYVSTRIKLTDFATALGCMHDRNNKENYAPYWTKACTTDHNHMQYEYDDDLKENIEIGYCYKDDYPIVSGYHAGVYYGDTMRANCDFISSIFKVPYEELEDLIIEKKYKDNDEEKQIPHLIKAGEYPQTVASEELHKELDEAKKQGSLIETGKKYSIDGEKIEYEYKGRKYIQHKVIKDKVYKHRNEIELSDGKKYKENDEIWIAVEPIEWKVSSVTGLAVTTRGLIAGIPFDNKENYYGDYEKTSINEYIENTFSKEIIPSRIKKPKTNYTFEEIETNEYLRKEISEMEPEFQKQVIVGLALEIKEKIEKVRKYTKELDEELGKIFDKEMKKVKTQEQKEESKQKTKVKTRGKKG